MIIDDTAKIIQGIYLIGSPGLPSYLVDGDFPAIVDAGIAFMGPSYIRAIRCILGDRKPTYLLLTHSHFDHCGAVSALISAFPSLKVVSSDRTRAIIGRKNAIFLIKQLSIAAEEMAQDMGIPVESSNGFSEFEVHRTVSEGDRLQISNTITIEVMETPGHTRDSLSYYIPERKVLFTGEAAGIQDQTGYIYSEWLVDVDAYTRSLRRLANLQPKGVCTGHNFAFTGKDAVDYLQRAIAQCSDFYRLIEKRLIQEKGDVEKVMAHIRKIEYDPKPTPKQAEPAYLLNLAAKIQAVCRKIQKPLEPGTS